MSAKMHYPAAFAAALICLLSVFLLTAARPAVAQSSDSEVEELRQLARQLQQQLKVIQQRLDDIEQNVSENKVVVEATASAVEEAQASDSGLDRISIGGYGELHYNNHSAEDSANDLDRIDFHRFVLFLGYEFSDKVHFFSEVELEHSLAGDDAPGEVELEQAFVEYKFDYNHAARVGLFLLPVGILNETHEPPAFYGVERNAVENIIIPTTWWAGGLGYTYRHDSGFQLDLALHEGLDVPDSARIRSGRQKTANAKADNFAGTGRIKYTGSPGLELSLSLQYQSDLSQDEPGRGLEDAIMYEAHGIYNKGLFSLRALYAAWDLDTRNNNPGNAIASAGNDEQYGWYVEPSYKLNDSLGLFVRYEDVEGARTADKFDQFVFGTNYWLHENVVLKADYFTRDYDRGTNASNIDNGYNLGFGFQF